MSVFGLHIGVHLRWSWKSVCTQYAMRAGSNSGFSRCVGHPFAFSHSFNSAGYDGQRYDAPRIATRAPYNSSGSVTRHSSRPYDTSAIKTTRPAWS